MNIAQNAKIDFSQVDTVTNCLKVLSNPDRLRILCVLVDGELNVQQIEESTDIHQPTLSQQLTVLRKNNIVNTRREGKQIFYQVSDPNVLVIMQTLYQLYCAV
ncbi:metalloregulator ArsR/SmtB family transcription factor [Acinetobacter bohemicus]|uniref:Metalloregulator ArsR/SmtB family transcription factor n=1 Tax=Acinetobacter lwoffii TaxID=28090 RepID=A0A9D2USG7_ACILW|nr:MULTISPECIES: metalloregulator ArsR/SmtB family transcription factor [Acinetobacter]MDM1781985.1 helix-turn-helix transcriptional regulator [Acinetobacter indicus]HJF27879.1 metalloregulator ArsR/SmtB family transcription factor [Acinetobacter lwoffii]MCO8043497.1 metalloregulator ArsR/SmtB family transcription factor [Acinetobacter sp. S4400-12]MCO8044474.1 metalloregulator ArsR/SmtB family transcription factor [Acinetobacter sp. S4397-1]MCU7225802.1 metalloregulator ArsR/SmtB family trans